VVLPQTAGKIILSNPASKPGGEVVLIRAQKCPAGGTAGLKRQFTVLNEQIGSLESE